MSTQTGRIDGLQSKNIRTGWRIGQIGWVALALFSFAVIAFLAFYNLTDYPRTWFDEGSHLHVPKALVTMGVYADYSSEGLRHFGPTIGVGPTVMLPIAAVFQIFDMGLFQARLVIVLYMLAAIAVFFRLGLIFGDRRFAWIAAALVVTSQGVSLVYYGRQVLGEVPGLFFLLSGLVIWFGAGERAGYGRLSLIGLLFGLAVVTKNQYLLLMVPTIGIAWVANLIYYRLMPQRFFIVPGIVMGLCYALWQVYIVLYLGPATAMENLTLLRNATAGAALVFSPELMKQSFAQLFSLNLYLGWLLPALLYAFFLALPRERKAQFWGILVIFAAFNLLWYVVASVGWLRYAFAGLVFGGLFVARLFVDLMGGAERRLPRLNEIWRTPVSGQVGPALQATMGLILAAMIALPLAQSAWDTLRPGENTPMVMAEFMDEQVPLDALVETWEPEMGFLTDHKYHYPPAGLLNTAVGYIWLDGPPPADSYDFVQKELPDYVLVGEFARWVELYPPDTLAESYTLVTQVGAYELYERLDRSQQGN
ncbi:hypothetical protein GC175_10865 [bacterium]|nr:hypothetical protein [bacterium]